MERAKLSLRWLEVFRVVASSGSVQQAAQRLGLSISTASQHLGALEDAVGIALIDHSKRPMRLTPAGQVFLGRVDEALGALNRGVTEIWSRDPGSWVRRLVISSIEDLDVAVIPPLASELARVMPGSELVFLSRSSHETVTLLEADDADLGITATAVRG
ncbi:MAG: LysR family transcriptional regulator, partial [Pseudomonadota bacterium]